MQYNFPFYFKIQPIDYRLSKIANVARIMKNSVPKNAKISKDAKEIVQECVSEFICFITSEAAEKCLLEKRKTIGGEDIIYAMSSLGFGDYSTVLKIYLAKMREVSSIRLPCIFPSCIRNAICHGT